MASNPSRGPGVALPGNGWVWLLVLGSLTVVAGAIMLLAPGMTTIAVTLLIGWLLLILGVAGIVMGVRSRRSTGRAWDVFMGALSAVAGIYTLMFPVSGALSLTLVIAAWLGVRGIIWLVAAVRSRPGGERALVGVTGVVDLALAILLFAGFPFPAVQFIGVAVGLSLIVGGAVMIASAFGLRRLQAA